VELAAFLAERGRTVTVIEEGKWLAPQMAIPRRWRTLHELREQGVTLLAGVRVEAIREKGVVIVSEKKGEKQTVECDHVILATGVVPNRGLCDELRERGREVHPLGDCAEVRYIEGSMTDGARMGREI
jgi:NADPH-dependent 2,4-dienoyl-CoA reductase/sulfur reductase-like enzyme